MIVQDLTKENTEVFTFDKDTLLESKGIVEMLQKIDVKLNKFYLTFKLTVDSTGLYSVDIVKKPITRTRKGNSSKFDLGSVLRKA
jgi:hypothetical protein